MYKSEPKKCIVKIASQEQHVSVITKYRLCGAVFIQHLKNVAMILLIFVGKCQKLAQNIKNPSTNCC